MTMLELPGRITEDGDLEIELPAGLPAGDVTVRIEVSDEKLDWERQPWTDEELRDLMTPHPLTGKEIAAMLEQMQPIELVNPEITDPVEWVQEQRRNRILP